MAPNASSDRQTKKPYGRLVQPVLPALPLIPGANRKKTKVVAKEQTKAEAIGSPSTPPSIANGTKTGTKAEASTDLSKSDVSQNGSHGDRETSISSE
jgi:hypothetical protein